MVTKPSVTSFTCKKLFTSPCKGFIRLFKFKKPIFIRRRRRTIGSRNGSNTRCLSYLTSFFRSTRDMDRVVELKSGFSDAQKAPCPSPTTPAYIKMGRSVMVGEENDVAEGCRKFEDYLVKMIGEEGKMRDLVDVEELLYCWKKLKSPVFINLVCRFYGELCKDLFSTNLIDEDINNHADISSLV